MTKLPVGSKVYDLDLLTVPEILELLDQDEVSNESREGVQKYLAKRQEDLFDRHLSSDLSKFYRTGLALMIKRYPDVDKYAREVLGKGYALFRVACANNIALVTKSVPEELCDGKHRRMEIACNYLDLATIFLLDNLGGTIELQLARQGGVMPTKPDNPWAAKEYRRLLQEVKKPKLKELTSRQEQRTARPEGKQQQSVNGKRTRQAKTPKVKEPKAERSQELAENVSVNKAERPRKKKAPKVKLKYRKGPNCLVQRYSSLQEMDSFCQFLLEGLKLLLATGERQSICEVATSEVWNMASQFARGKGIAELSAKFPGYLRIPGHTPQESVCLRLELLILSMLSISGERLLLVLTEAGFTPQMEFEEWSKEEFARLAGGKYELYIPPESPLPSLTPRERDILLAAYQVQDFKHAVAKEKLPEAAPADFDKLVRLGYFKSWKMGNGGIAFGVPDGAPPTVPVCVEEDGGPWLPGLTTRETRVVVKAYQSRNAYGAVSKADVPEGSIVDFEKAADLGYFHRRKVRGGGTVYTVLKGMTLPSLLKAMG